MYRTYYGQSPLREVLGGDFVILRVLEKAYLIVMSASDLDDFCKWYTSQESCALTETSPAYCHSMGRVRKHLPHI